jgi:hypothetical protein
MVYVNYLRGNGKKLTKSKVSQVVLGKIGIVHYLHIEMFITYLGINLLYCLPTRKI